VFRCRRYVGASPEPSIDVDDTAATAASFRETLKVAFASWRPDVHLPSTNFSNTKLFTHTMAKLIVFLSLIVVAFMVAVQSTTAFSPLAAPKHSIRKSSHLPPH
jgi:hypothetical protein